MSRMRKTAVDAALRGYWQQAVSERRAFELGLIIGQTSASAGSDALLTGIPVPSESEDEEARSFDDISIDWVQEYAKQIDRLLPGGISIVGLYVVSAAPARSVFDQSTFYLRAVAEALRLPDEFAVLYNSSSDSSSVHYVVHVCPNTSKTSAKSVFDILDATKTDAIPAELKSSLGASSDALALRKFTTTIAVDEQIAFLQTQASDDDHDAAVERALDELQQQLLPLAKRVQSATGILKSRGGEPSSKVLLLTSPSAASLSQRDEEDGSRDQTRRRGSFRGAINCVAYVLASEPNARDAVVASLKRDFLKSLLLRVELLREKFAADDDAASSDANGQSALLLVKRGGELAFPKRASLPWSSALGSCAHFPALLHMFQEDGDDNEQELAVQNALEILGSKVNPSSSAASLSFLEGDSQQQQQQPNKNSKNSKSASKTPPSASAGTVATKAEGSDKSSNSLFMALAVLLVLLAIVAQRFLL